MSATATTERTTGRTPEQEAARRAAAYHRRVEVLRRRYRSRARRNTICANAVSLLLVATGAGVGVTALDPVHLGTATVLLGTLVVLLEGVSRVLRPSLRAGRARRTARALDRECRLYDARGGGYRGSEPAADAAFVDAVERILDRASAEEDRDDAGPAPDTSPAPAGRRGLRPVD